MSLGVIFTPPRWARWVVRKYGIHQLWADGATVLDPTAGEGSLLAALVEVAREQGLQVTGEMLSRLHAVELEAEHLVQLRRRLLRHGLAIPEANLVQADYLRTPPKLQADVLLGNPPWANFTDLPDDYKELTRPLYLHYGLVRDKRSVLLGNSRVDVAALFICRALRENLSPGGKAYFFLPLSMLLNDGAHQAFRGYRVRGVDFCVDEVHDFSGRPVFDGVATRYGLAALTRDRPQRFPLRYLSWDAAARAWQTDEARPTGGAGDGPLELSGGHAAPLIRVDRGSVPRQGINTCGANSIFLFEQAHAQGPGVVRVRDAAQRRHLLPAELVHPLIGREQFQQPGAAPQRHVLVPHDRCSGRPLTAEQLQQLPLAWDYLRGHEQRLRCRKGVLINSWIGRGRWWALLGVGDYSYAPYKVVWQAYGKRTFEPLLFACSGSNWQANQAMQAFMPFWSEAQASTVLERLRDPAIQQCLLRQRMAGTCNWAQPGRIKRFLELV